MTEVTALRQNELSDIRVKLENLRTQRSVILANEELKSGGRGKKVEESIEYCDTQIQNSRDILARKLKEVEATMEQKLSVLEQKKRALADDYDRRRQKLEAEFECKNNILEMESDKIRQKSEVERNESETKNQSYEMWLEKTKASKEASLLALNEIKSAATMSLDRQIRELEKQELWTAQIVDMCLTQAARNYAPIPKTTAEILAEAHRRPDSAMPPSPWDADDAELAQLRADAKREAAERKAKRECPYSPLEMEYRKHT
jgi:hypothetical protein